MKVALVHDYLREYGGAERVLEVLHELFPEASVYTSYYFQEKMPERFRSWEIRTSFLQRFPLVSSFPKLYTYLLPYAFEQFDLRAYDLVISSSTSFAKGVLTHPNQVHICYCHTPARFLWGLQGEVQRSGLMSLLLSPFDSFLRRWDYTSAQRVDYFIANSENVKERIKRFWQKDAVVIHPPIKMTQSVGEVRKESYFLVVSRLEKFKHIDLIIQAFNELQLPLKIVGRGSEEGALKALAGKNVEFMGFVEGAVLNELYAKAQALVLATEDEDFGMTPLEANAQGTPVVAYRSGGVKETVVDGETGVLYDDLSVESLKDAIEKFRGLKFEADRLKNQAKQFSEEQFKLKLRTFLDTISR